MSADDAKKYLKFLHEKEAECRGDLTRLEEGKILAECRAKFLEYWRGQK